MHRAGVNTGPPGGLETPLVPPISVLFVHSQASLFGFHPLPLGIWMCILVQCLLHFSLSLKYLHLGVQASAAGGPFALPFIASRRIFPKWLWYQQIPGSLRTSSFAICASLESSMSVALGEWVAIAFQLVVFCHSKCRPGVASLSISSAAFPVDKSPFLCAGWKQIAN